MTEQVLAEKFAVLKPYLNERQWRLVLAAEAEANSTKRNTSPGLSTLRNIRCPLAACLAPGESWSNIGFQAS